MPGGAAAEVSADLVLTLQRVLDNGFGLPVARDGRLGQQTLRAWATCRQQLGLAPATPDSAAIAALLVSAWQDKHNGMVARQAGGALAQARHRAGLADMDLELYLRVFKREGILELFARARGSDRPFVRLREYRLTANPFAYPDSSAWQHPSPPFAHAGPKMQQGDRHMPEGCYRLVWLNPWSRFRLSVSISYPNGADISRRQRLGTPGPPGGQIVLHGGAASIGCVAVGDPAIEELYLLLSEQGRPGDYGRIDVLPLRFDDEGLRVLNWYARRRPELVAHWASLRAVCDYFARRGAPPPIAWDESGCYLVPDAD